MHLYICSILCTLCCEQGGQFYFAVSYLHCSQNSVYTLKSSVSYLNCDVKVLGLQFILLCAQSVVNRVFWVQFEVSYMHCVVTGECSLQHIGFIVYIVLWKV